MNHALPPPPNLRITFPPPGFFLADARLLLTIDGYPAYDGSFKQGMDRVYSVAPGHHQIIVYIEMGIVSRNRVYPITLIANRGYSLVLEYSRLWGNFAKTPKLVEHG